MSLPFAEGAADGSTGQARGKWLAAASIALGSGGLGSLLALSGILMAWTGAWERLDPVFDSGPMLWVLLGLAGWTILGPPAGLVAGLGALLRMRKRADSARYRPAAIVGLILSAVGVVFLLGVGLLMLPGLLMTLDFMQDLPPTPGL